MQVEFRRVPSDNVGCAERVGRCRPCRALTHLLEPGAAPRAITWRPFRPGYADTLRHPLLRTPCKAWFRRFPSDNVGCAERVGLCRPCRALTHLFEPGPAPRAFIAAFQAWLCGYTDMLKHGHHTRPGSVAFRRILSDHISLQGERGTGRQDASPPRQAGRPPPLFRRFPSDGTARFCR